MNETPKSLWNCAADQFSLAACGFFISAALPLGDGIFATGRGAALDRVTVSPLCVRPAPG